MAAMAPSSPRLPSPPPPAEIQLGPKSPSMGGISASREAQQMEQTALQANSKRRIHVGTTNADFAAGPPLIPLNELDSPFQLQEHLAALHYHHTASNTHPLTRDTALILATPPPGIDRTLWLYELCRFLIMQCNSLLVGFLFDTPPCSAATCPEMRASEWQFLCAVHEQPKSCCAIDYCCHTLDWAANVVTNPKIFPSRFVVPSGDGGENGSGVPQQVSHNERSAAVKNLVNVFRRLHRIFAHAWFQHKGVFWSVEGQTGLYVFFKTVCDLYDLLPAENYKLPPEAEGLDSGLGEDAIAEPPSAVSADRRSSVVPTAIASRPKKGGDGSETLDDDHLQPVPSVGRTNTRRHIRGSPSTGAAVTTVLEQDEDEGVGATGAASAGHIASRMKELRISAPQASVDEDEEAGNEEVDVPVVVEHEERTDATEKQQSDSGDDTTVLLSSDDEKSQEPLASADDVAESSKPVAKTDSSAAGRTEKIPEDDAKDAPAVKTDDDTATDEAVSKEASQVTPSSAAVADEAASETKPKKSKSELAESEPTETQAKPTTEPEKELDVKKRDDTKKTEDVKDEKKQDKDEDKDAEKDATAKDHDV